MNIRDGAGPNKYGRDLYEAYWETYTGVRRFNDNIVKKAMRDGYLISKFSGLRLWLPSINSSDEFVQAKEWRVACNFAIQSGNFLMLRAIHKMQEWIEEEELQDDVKTVLTVHDSVMYYVKDDSKLVSKVNNKLIEVMGAPYEDGQTISLDAEFDIGRNYKDFVTLPNEASLDTIEEALNSI